MNNPFITSLALLLAINIMSYGMENLHNNKVPTKESIRDQVNAIYAVINTAQKKLDPSQKKYLFTQLIEQADDLTESAALLSASLEQICRELHTTLNETLDSPEST